MCKEKILKNQKGFTLVELLIVVGLVALSVGVTSDILLNIIRSYNKIQVINEIEQQANFIGLKMDRELKNADSVISVDPNEIVFNDVDGVQIGYKVEDEKVKRKEGAAGTYQELTYTDLGGTAVSCVGPSGACFSYVGASGLTPVIIKYSMLFQQGQPTSILSSSGEVFLKNIVVIRHTYR